MSLLDLHPGLRQFEVLRVPKQVMLFPCHQQTVCVSIGVHKCASMYVDWYTYTYRAARPARRPRARTASGASVAPAPPTTLHPSRRSGPTPAARAPPNPRTPASVLQLCSRSHPQPVPYSYQHALALARRARPRSPPPRQTGPHTRRSRGARRGAARAPCRAGARRARSRCTAPSAR